jgi:hypothetical protein
VISLDNTASFNPSRLVLTNPNQIGSAQVVVNSNSGILFQGGTYGNAFTIAGAGWDEGNPALGRLGALRFQGNSTLSGPVTLTANSRLTTHEAWESGTISGSISGNFEFQKTGAGTLTLSGTNTFGNLNALALQRGLCDRR